MFQGQGVDNVGQLGIAKSPFVSEDLISSISGDLKSMRLTSNLRAGKEPSIYHLRYLLYSFSTLFVQLEKHLR